MCLAKVQNKTFYPVCVSLFGANTVMLEADLPPDLIKQLRLLLS